jgi:hypothetical protein
VRTARLKKENLMAIYHLTVKTISRGGTSSAKARSEYIDREGRYRADVEEILHKESGNMPEWAHNHPRAYWQAADENERANGRLFKQVEFAFPRELTPEQQIELARVFCKKLAQAKSGPLPYSFALHKGHDKGNPHCHLMISERINDGHRRSPETWFKRASKKPGDGGARKTDELKPKDWLIAIRQEWRLQANAALERAGHEARIDHHSLKDQGIDREPTVHFGPAAAAMERRGIKTERGREYQNCNTALLEVLHVAKTLENAIRASKEILPMQK